MPQSSSPYTDLILPTLKQDNSTYGSILNTYFQALENKLKAISDRVNAAGVGDSSTLAQINSDIEGILPDPYSGDYSTVSTWPAYNTELTALGLSPPQTASEILAFFSGSDITTFVNFLDGKLDAIDAILTVAESDLETAQLTTCHVDKILDAVNPTTTTYGTITVSGYQNVTDTGDSCYGTLGGPYVRMFYTGTVPSGFTGVTVYVDPANNTSATGTFKGLTGSGISGTYIFCLESEGLSSTTVLPNGTYTWVTFTRYAYPSACTVSELSPPYFS
jgi:hypothetical protein